MSRPFTVRAVAGVAAGIQERLRLQHVIVARKARAEIEARQGVVPTLVTVDGRSGASESDVRPGGSIVYRFDAAPRAAAEAKIVAQQIAPVDDWKTKDDRVFRDSFLFLVDDQEAPLEAARPGSTIVLLNRRFGYSRRLEKGWSLQAPSGVMEVVAALLKPRWRRSVDIEFTYMPINGLSDDPRDEPSGRYPVITFRGRAFL